MDVIIHLCESADKFLFIYYFFHSCGNWMCLKISSFYFFCTKQIYLGVPPTVITVFPRTLNDNYKGKTTPKLMLET